MNTFLSISLAAILAGCSQRALAPTPAPAPFDLAGAPDAEMQKHVGENVTMHGQFSLYGKIGPFILVAGRPIYLVAHGSFSWGERYASMEGQDVRVIGTLRFAHEPEPPPGDSPVARASDHFYFEAETVKVELSQKSSSL